MKFREQRIAGLFVALATLLMGSMLYSGFKSPAEKDTQAAKISVEVQPLPTRAGEGAVQTNSTLVTSSTTNPSPSDKKKEENSLQSDRSSLAAFPRWQKGALGLIGLAVLIYGIYLWHSDRAHGKIKAALSPLATLLGKQNGSYGTDNFTKEASDAIKTLKLLMGYEAKEENKDQKLDLLLKTDPGYLKSAALLGFLKEGSNFAWLYFHSSPNGNKKRVSYAMMIARDCGFVSKVESTPGGDDQYGMTYKQANDFLALLKKAGTYLPEGVEEGVGKLKQRSSNMNSAGKKLAQALSNENRVDNNMATARNNLKKLFLTEEEKQVREALRKGLDDGSEDNLSVLDSMPASFFLLGDGQHSPKSSSLCLANDVVEKLDFLSIRSEHSVSDGKKEHSNDKHVRYLTNDEIVKLRSRFIRMMQDDVGYEIKSGTEHSQG